MPAGRWPSLFTSDYFMNRPVVGYALALALVPSATALGVGLSISRTIIEAHGGEIRAEPNPAGGTTFRFTLPAVSKEEVDND